MAKPGLFDLERHFAFYGAYHSNPVNVAIHMVFVWPILFTALLLLCFTPSLFGLPRIELSLFGHDLALVLNIGCLLTLIYSAFYVFLDPRAESLAAPLRLICWVAANFVASRLGFSLAWKAEIAGQEARLKMEKKTLRKRSVLMGTASQDNQDGAFEITVSGEALQRQRNVAFK